MKNIWLYVQKVVNDDTAVHILSGVLKKYDDILAAKNNVKAKSLLRGHAVYVICNLFGISLGDVLQMNLVPRFSDWLKTIVDEIWTVTFEPEFTKAA